ncbi:MAG: hypothetical protein HY690_07485 [Chloroflexi bacterium]|nr:hypothetical protein [Chloroflexota bacterium]
MAQRLLLAALGLAIAVFALWGSWEAARQIPTAPQALLAAVGLALFGLLALAATALGAAGETFTTETRRHGDSS